MNRRRFLKACAVVALWPMLNRPEVTLRPTMDTLIVSEPVNSWAHTKEWFIIVDKGISETDGHNVRLEVERGKRDSHDDK